jgi:hypothetical protein
MVSGGMPQQDPSGWPEMEDGVSGDAMTWVLLVENDV